MDLVAILVMKENFVSLTYGGSEQKLALIGQAVWKMKMFDTVGRRMMAWAWVYSRDGVIKKVIVINCNLITFSKIIEC